MKLDSLKVKNFRTIKTEQTIDLCRSLTIVGPNNSGKTNILKAIEMFFTGHDNKHQYSIDDDLSFHVENEQTSLSAIFSSDDPDTDKSLLDLYCAMNQMLEEPNSIDGKFTLNLYFTKTGKPVYRFNYKKVKKEHKEEFDEKQLSFVSLLLNSFECHYVPSSKTTTELYSLLLLPFIKRSIAQILEDKVIEINENLRLISDSLDEQMTLSGLCHIKSHFEISKGSLKDLINDFDFYLSDPNKTLINKKGMGIQAAAIFSSFLWITKEERKIGKNVIWLIEEPESYLHPALAESCHNMLNGLREDALLITTTHSLGFVSKDYRQIVGVEVDSGCTNIRKYSSYLDATSSIREALGIRFSDYYNLGEINLFVEGKTDREILKWFLNFIKPKANEKYLWLYVRQANFYEFGGVKGITGFMKATYTSGK
jgi:predicted ATP-dependent endonuclease of OLD family